MADATTHTYELEVEMSDGTTKSAGTFTVTDGIDGTNGTDGKDGTDGVTPVVTIDASATVDGSSATITVSKSGSDEAPTFAMDFSSVASAIEGTIPATVTGISLTEVS